MGKSLLLEVASRQLRRTGASVVKINVVGITPEEFVWKLAAALGHVTAPDATIVECWQAITDQLIANRYQRLPTVVMLDDVDDAQRDVQAAISRLSLIDPHPDARFTMLLTGQRQRMHGLGSKLNDLCELRIDLEPWEADETIRYIDFALKHVGARENVFAAEALEAIHQLAHGIPRRIRQLAELSLLAGASEELPEISSAVVESVQSSLAVDGVSEAA